VRKELNVVTRRADVLVSFLFINTTLPRGNPYRGYTIA